MKCTSSVAINLLSVCLWCCLLLQSLLVQSLNTTLPGGITDGVYMYYAPISVKLGGGGGEAGHRAGF